MHPKICILGVWTCILSGGWVFGIGANHPSCWVWIPAGPRSPPGLGPRQGRVLTGSQSTPGPGSRRVRDSRSQVPACLTSGPMGSTHEPT